MGGRRKIGRLEAFTGRIGFSAPEGADNRYHSPCCCAAELRRISRFMPMKSRPGWSMSLVRKTHAAANLDQTGVDLTDQVTVKFETCAGRSL